MRRPPILESADSVAEAFYEAMRRGDLAGMMALWSPEDEVVCTHPGHDRIVGLSAIRASWEGIFANGGVEVQPAHSVVHAGTVMAVHNLIEGVVVSGPLGRQVIECVVTNVYVKTSSGWRIVLHHGSPAGDIHSAAPAGVALH